MSQLCISTERFECLIHVLELRRGFFLSLTLSDTPHYENVPFEIPNSWVWTTLGSVCNFENGFAFSSDDYKQTGVPLIRISNISDNTIDLNGCVFIQKEIDDRFVVEKGDLLIALSGATTGKMGVYSTDKVAYLNQRVGNLRIIDTSVLCHEYRNIFINSRTEAILKLAYGGAQPNISGSVICSFSFPLPPLAEQLRIATEVNHWFALIDQIEQGKADLQETIKQTKSKILDLAIHGKLVPQDPNDEPAIELLKRINLDYTPCDNRHYENLPSGWAMCKLSDLCRIENGFAFSSNDYKPQGTPLVRISNITHNMIDITDCVYIEGAKDDKFKISKGDLLIAMSGATTGKMGVYMFDDTAYLNQRVGNIKILNKSSLSPDYRNAYMQSKVDEILKIAYGGAQPNISASVIGNFNFPLPPYKEQIRIVETIRRIFDQLDIITESL